MKVILSKDIAGLGRAGQIKEVSDGHARNFLIPKHLAMPATTSALIRVQKEETEREEKIKRLQAATESLKHKLEGKTFKVLGKTKGIRLFAGIHEAEIANAISEKLHLAISPQQVIIRQAIKTIGTHEVEIKLTDSIQTHVKIEVENQK